MGELLAVVDDDEDVVVVAAEVEDVAPAVRLFLSGDSNSFLILRFISAEKREEKRILVRNHKSEFKFVTS